jgi:uncharacterized protein with GYD domain
MATYVTLANFTQKGAEHVGESKSRFANFEAAVKEAGGRVVSAYGVLGEYDLVVITEFPDDKAGWRTIVKLASLGNVNTKTLSALPIKEFYQMVDEALGAVAARR